MVPSSFIKKEYRRGTESMRGKERKREGGKEGGKD